MEVAPWNHWMVAGLPLADALNVTTDYLLGRTEHPALSGPALDKMARHAEHFTDEDLRALENMAEALAKKNRKT